MTVQNAATMIQLIGAAGGLFCCAMLVVEVLAMRQGRIISLELCAERTPQGSLGHKLAA